jgi:hypothetical protein
MAIVMAPSKGTHFDQRGRVGQRWACSPAAGSKTEENKTIEKSCPKKTDGRKPRPLNRPIYTEINSALTTLLELPVRARVFSL